MAWNNWNDDRRNGGGWGNGRSNYRNNDYYPRNNYNGNGWGNDRFNDRPPRQFMYAEGQQMCLKARPDLTMTIIRIGREQYECRMHDTLDVKWFYEDELMAIEEKK